MDKAARSIHRRDAAEIGAAGLAVQNKRPPKRSSKWLNS